YRGKPAVRNDRGDRGNVGIIEARSAPRSYPTCSEASCHFSGCKSRQQRSPVAVVVISSNGEGDRSGGSLEVKALGGRAYRSDPYRRASNLTGRSKCVNQEAPKDGPRVKRSAGGSGVPSCSELGEGQ